MRAIAIAILALLPSISMAEVKHIPNNYNEELGKCLVKYGYDKTAPIEERMRFDFSKASRCANKYLEELHAAQDAELRDFLKHNPRYRVPGQSNNKCWGKPREMPFEKSTISVGPNGMHASVWYKDKLPAGCFEHGPWDNRDNK